MKKRKPRNYYYIHWALRVHKTGKCKRCKAQGKTQLAKKHNKKHEKKIENYLELCSKCHIAYDRTEAKVLAWKRSLARTHSHTTVIRQKACEQCNEPYTPAKKSRRFCSNSCSSKWKSMNGITKPPVARLWLALSKSNQLTPTTTE